MFERLCADGLEIALRKRQVAKNTVEFQGALLDENKIEQLSIQFEKNIRLRRLLG